MKYYKVICREIAEVSYSIEADLEDEAREKAMQGEGHARIINAEHDDILDITEV